MTLTTHKQAIDLEVKSYILKHELDEEILRKTLENIKQHLDRRMISAMRKKWDAYQAALERGFAALPGFLKRRCSAERRGAFSG